MTAFSNTAVLSHCRTRRYMLRRWWGPGLRNAVFIGLNPSTADETEDDPTIRRCVAFAKQWGMDGLYMINLFSLRATDPDVMKAHAEPNDARNNQTITEITTEADIVIAAWGKHGSHLGRDKDVMEKLSWWNCDIKCLAFNNDGSPRHPLYVRGDFPPVPFNELWASFW